MAVSSDSVVSGRCFNVMTCWSLASVMAISPRPTAHE
jgi:hypothetical protein